MPVGRERRGHSERGEDGDGRPGTSPRAGAADAYTERVEYPLVVVTTTADLGDCAAWLALAAVDRSDVGDHVAVVTRPVGGGPGTGRGLLTSATTPPLAADHPVA